jgi:hypothetical protein
MKKAICKFSFLLIAIFTIVKVKCQTYNLNNIITCGNTRITAQEILEQRIPLSNFSNSIPEECRSKISDLKSNWRNADKSNIDRIVNEYCSHKNGWTEYESGTCQAGGPPPICTADHWYKNTEKAKEQWKLKMDALLKQRANEAKSAACECWGNNLEKNFEHQNNSLMKAIAPQADLDNQQNQEIRTPCLQISGSDPCPPGYKCKDGYCVLINDVQKGLTTLGAIGGKVIEKITKDKLKSMLSDFSSTLYSAYKVYSNPWVKAGNIDGY